MSITDIAVIIILIAMIVFTILKIRCGESMSEEYADALLKKGRRDTYDMLKEELESFWNKTIKVHGIIYAEFGKSNEYVLSNAFIVTISSKEIKPIRIRANIRINIPETIQSTGRFNSEYLPEHFECKGSFSEREINNERFVEFDMISARKLSKVERKRILQMN